MKPSKPATSNSTTPFLMTTIIDYVLLCLTILLAYIPFSANSSTLEGEKPFAEFRNEDNTSSMRFAAYMQARVEYGDLVVGPDQTVRNSEFDLYFRKIAFGVYGSALYKVFKYGLTFSGDQTPQKNVVPSYSAENGVTINDTYLQYFYDGTNYLKFGNSKFPLSRIYLVSSTKQLFAERPYYIYDWENVLHSYAATNFSAGGKLLGDTLTYNFSVSKAWRYRDELYQNENILIFRSDPFMAARLDWSPDQWQEDKYADTYMGYGQHFVIGSYVAQQSIDYSVAESNYGRELRLLYGANISTIIENITVQAEINGTKISSDIQAKNKISSGWLIQAAYIFQNKMIEPVFRYEYFDSNKNIPNTSVQTITIGVNKYINGNSLKIGANLEHSKFEDSFYILRPVGDSVKNVLRVTFQFVL